MMSGPVVVPLDGSPFAAVAVPMGRLLAELTSSELHLVHVMATPVPDAFHPELQLMLDEHVRSRSLRYLESLASTESPDGSLRLRAAQLDGMGGVASAIARYAGDVDASWVVLTTHGAGGLSRLLAGSVADGLARVATTPLLFLRPWDGTGSLAADERRFRRILVPLDGSADSEAALDCACALARTFGASLTLVRVVPPTSVGGWIDSVQVRSGRSRAIDVEAALYLEDHVEDLREQRLGAEAWPVASANVAKGILSEAMERAADAIVMATHGRGGFERVVLGSVADEVLRHATIPLALVHPQRSEGSSVAEARRSPGHLAEKN